MSENINGLEAEMEEQRQQCVAYELSLVTAEVVYI
jgi:hypothetical protein